LFKWNRWHGGRIITDLGPLHRPEMKLTDREQWESARARDLNRDGDLNRDAASFF
jgi:hypothetical protein